MNDRERLELAAKAAGIEIEWEAPYVAIGDFVQFPHNAATGDLWNPLTDDGDALRLAVKLGVFDGGPEFALYRMIECMSGIGIEAATRRAIVRAAAEIGKAMP